VKILLLRHAARSNQEYGDISLSSAGRSQAQELVSQLSPNGPNGSLLPRPTLLFCSPKKRTRETLTPIAHALQLTLTIDTLLDERQRGESAQVFAKRVGLFLNGIEKYQAEPEIAKEPVIWVCSHLDWLENALAFLDANPSDALQAGSWSNCEYRVFQVTDGLWSPIGGSTVRPRNSPDD
jgi:broad specificity phosphatase PhoE